MAEVAGTTIYIGGFTENTNANHILKAFAPFGNVLDVQLPPDPSHRSSHRGFAFLTYSTGLEAQQAIDNMHSNVLREPEDNLVQHKALKVNAAKATKGLKVGGSNRAIWSTEEWLAENEGAKNGQEGANGEDAEMGEQ